MLFGRFALALFAAASFNTVQAENVSIVNAKDIHIGDLRDGTSSYLVYMHGKPGTGIKRPTLTTSKITRERVDGADAWVIEQSWEDENGISHTARTVHAAGDIATLAQTTMWTWSKGRFRTTVDPKAGIGTLEGDVPPQSREKIEAGFPTMKQGWWFNWHSDLALLPLLPFEKGGTLRVHLFDVGMPAPMDVDYVVVGSRSLEGGDGTRYDCWLVETDSGSPGTGNFQRFWIDKARRVVIKEEDTFNGMYRSKILLSVPAVTEFPAPTPTDQK